MPETSRSFVLVLHTHLPYVLSHGKWPHGMDWLNEAAAECYLPLLNAFERMVSRGVSPRVTIGITPVLAEQLADAAFKDDFGGYLRMKVDAAKTDEAYFHKIGDTQREELACYWQMVYRQLIDDFENYSRDIIGSFRELQDGGHIEIMTSAATHGYLALLGKDECVRAQVRQGVETYRRHFGRSPRGIWLPECAYRPPYNWTTPVPSEIEPADRLGIDSILSDNGLEYFVLDTHLLRGGKAIGAYIDRFGALKALWEQFEEAYPDAKKERDLSPLLPYYAGGVLPRQKPVAFFTRHPECSLQVWSGEWGYPGDGAYLDFHKKHFPGGHRYWAVTGRRVDLGDKVLYDPAAVEARLEENADHFVDLVGKALDGQGAGNPALVCAPFDTELFGHWWFEGPRWIEKVLTKMAERADYQPATGSDALKAIPPRQILSVPEGSWGEGGYHYIWLNDLNKWTWTHVYDAERTYCALVEELATSTLPEVHRVLKQAARELLLLESSDWQFLISTWSARDYAELRFTHHWETIKRLFGIMERLARRERLEESDWLFVEECEAKDGLFPDIEPRWWMPGKRVLPGIS
ncbi:MAG TPA: DUF1957 domain-containing protein [Candidatus Latescibacteria bacterium]|nr:DUF1957 domain-containing protein [Candidatus Latescibacterota bacterium]